MSTTDTTLRCKKPARTVRHIATTPGGMVVFAITEGKKCDRYMAGELRTDYGTAYRVEKLCPGGNVYDVMLDDGEGNASCDCLGFTHWRHCRHIGALKALQAAGKF